MARKARRRRVGPHPDRLRVRGVGPLLDANITFGDLTVLVGPQASGKSIFLETLKLVVDAGAIRSQLERFNFAWRSAPEFAQLYFGEGMGGILGKGAVIETANRGSIEPGSLAQARRSDEPRLFYVPAQRVMSVRDGVTRPFTQFVPGDPFVLRDFGETTHNFVQGDFIGEADLFPRSNRLHPRLRKGISDSLFGGFSLRVESERLQRRLVLTDHDGTTLPFGVWSAGQREFVPLLLGLYWLLPPSATSRRKKLEWVVIEEPEAGLHPKAVVVVMALILELLHRGYRVCVSTHSSEVLEFVWALGVAKSEGGTPGDVARLLDLGSGQRMMDLATSALDKTYRVYYLERGMPSLDISALDPTDESRPMAEWGGLSGFAGRASDVVSEIVRRRRMGKNG